MMSNQYPEIPADLVPRPGTEKHSEEYPRLDQVKPRMTDAQRDKLWDLCGRYNVPFREDDYHPAIFNNGMVEGWVGGSLHNGTNGFKRTIYIGVEPNGDSHS